MPWDQGAVPQCLADYVLRHPLPAKVLIPGCGSAHEVRLLHQSGWPVTAIDFSPAAVAHARMVLGPLASVVREADFFGGDLEAENFDVIYERAFLCALPHGMRIEWGKRVARLLPPGGKLIGFFFFAQTERGPPFGIGLDELDGLLANDFELIEDRVPPDSISVFAGKERWQVWKRR